MLGEEKTYGFSDIIIRQDNRTGNLCLYIVELKNISSQESSKVVAKETNVKDASNVIRWQGVLKPAARGWARNYLNENDYQRYGIICSKANTITIVDSDYNYDKTYTKQELVSLIDRINEKRNKKDEFGDIEPR